MRCAETSKETIFCKVIYMLSNFFWIYVILPVSLADTVYLSFDICGRSLQTTLAAEHKKESFKACENVSGLVTVFLRIPFPVFFRSIATWKQQGTKKDKVTFESLESCLNKFFLYKKTLKYCSFGKKIFQNAAEWFSRQYLMKYNFFKIYGKDYVLNVSNQI